MTILVIKNTTKHVDLMMKVIYLQQLKILFE